jgi:hypothetical protein
MRRLFQLDDVVDVFGNGRPADYAQRFLAEHLVAQQGLPRIAINPYKIASTIARRGCFSGRPPVLTAGNSGSISSHCWSLRSDG